MISHARAEAPDECCGILAGVGSRVLKLYQTTNAEHSPDRFSIEPRQLIAIYQEVQRNRRELLGIYHSHTHSEAYPSPTDIKSAVLSEPVYFIISLADPLQPVLRTFRIVEGKVTEIRLKIIET